MGGPGPTQSRSPRGDPEVSGSWDSRTPCLAQQEEAPDQVASETTVVDQRNRAHWVGSPGWGRQKQVYPGGRWLVEGWETRRQVCVRGKRTGKKPTISRGKQGVRGLGGGWMGEATCVVLLVFKNLSEIQLTCHLTDPFEEHNSVVLVSSQSCAKPLPKSIVEHFHRPQKKPHPH